MKADLYLVVVLIVMLAIGILRAYYLYTSTKDPVKDETEE